MFYYVSSYPWHIWKISTEFVGGFIITLFILANAISDDSSSGYFSRGCNKLGDPVIFIVDFVNSDIAALPIVIIFTSGPIGTFILSVTIAATLKAGEVIIPKALVIPTCLDNPSLISVISDRNHKSSQSKGF